MILSLREDNRSFTVNFKGVRHTVTHIPTEFPDDVGRHICILFGPYLVMEPSPALAQESQPEAKEVRTKRKHK